MMVIVSMHKPEPIPIVLPQNQVKDANHISQEFNVFHCRPPFPSIYTSLYHATQKKTRNSLVFHILMTKQCVSVVLLQGSLGDPFDTPVSCASHSLSVLVSAGHGRQNATLQQTQSCYASTSSELCTLCILPEKTKKTRVFTNAVRHIRGCDFSSNENKKHYQGMVVFFQSLFTIPVWCIFARASGTTELSCGPLQLLNNLEIILTALTYSGLLPSDTSEKKTV